MGIGVGRRSDHRDRLTPSNTPAWIKTRIFSPVTEPECPSGIVSGIFDPVWVSHDPFGIVFGIFDPFDMVENPSRGWLGAGPKKSGGPAPQIAIVCTSVAQAPRPKLDPRHFEGDLLQYLSSLAQRGRCQGAHVVFAAAKGAKRQGIRSRGRCQGADVVFAAAKGAKRKGIRS